MKKIYRNKLLLFVVVACMGVIFVSAMDNNAYADYTISMTSSGAQSIDISAGGNGTAISADNITVTTNCRAGYNFTMATSVSNNNLYLNGDISNNASGTYFSPVDGTSALSSTSNKNKWGYYYNSSTPTTAPTSDSVFTAVPVISSPATVVSPTSSATDINDSFNIYYGVAVSSGLAPGTYKMIPDTNNSNNDGTIIYYLTLAEVCMPYLVQFNPTSTAGGTTLSGTGTMGPQTIPAGTPTNLNANTFTAPNGYVFDGWNTAQDGTGTSYTDGQSVTDLTTGGGSITLYAQWKVVPSIAMQAATMADCGKTMFDDRGVAAYRNVAYTTTKIGDFCWMTRNLDLPGGTTLTSSDSNVTSNYALPASSTSGFDDNTKAFVYNSDPTNFNDTSCGNNNPCYSYYSYAAATAGTNPSSGEASSDICPKGWRLPTQAELVTFYSSYNTGAKLTASPFLGVYAGHYASSSLSNGGSDGSYWSSTANSSDFAYPLFFRSSNANVNYNAKFYGRSVRCVKSSDGYMQDQTQSSLAAMMPNTGDTTTLTDRRDGHNYTVAKIGSLYWMTQNLDLPGGITLTPSDSNVTSDYPLPASSISGFSDASTAYVYKSGSTNFNDTSCGNNNPCYSYYSYAAATAGTNPSSGEASSDICPKGWRLPTQAEFVTLYSSYNTGAKLTASPFLGVYAGRYYGSSLSNGGSSGYYWSSTAYNASNAYYLYFNSSYADVNYSGKNLGHSVRCVMKSYMQDQTQSSLAAMMPNEGDTTTLVDKRDSHNYTVAKIGSLYWMTQNLDLPGGTTLTPSDSNVASNYILPASSTSGFSDNSMAYVYNSDSTNFNDTSCGNNNPCYSYYSYAAATAGTNPSSGEASFDICPKGWRLPTQAELNTLKGTYTTGAALHASPLVYAGFYDSSSFVNGGSYGYYWSSTASNASNADYLMFDSSYYAYVNFGDKRYGFSVRCVAQS